MKAQNVPMNFIKTANTMYLNLKDIHFSAKKKKIFPLVTQTRTITKFLYFRL